MPAPAAVVGDVRAEIPGERTAAKLRPAAAVRGGIETVEVPGRATAKLRRRLALNGLGNSSGDRAGRPLRITSLRACPVPLGIQPSTDRLSHPRPWQPPPPRGSSSSSRGWLLQRDTAGAVAALAAPVVVIVGRGLRRRALPLPLRDILPLPLPLPLWDILLPLTGTRTHTAVIVVGVIIPPAGTLAALLIIRGCLSNFLPSR